VGLITFLHQRLALALFAYALILGVWGTYGFVRRRQVGGGYRSSYLLMAGLTAVQSLAGAVDYLQGGRPRETLHLVYGLFAIVFLPAIFVIAQRGPETEQTRAREAALLAAACWIVLIAFARGFATGR
jgi:hypothetical protein